MENFNNNNNPIQIVVDQPKPASSFKLWHFIVVGVVVFYAVRWIRNIGRKITRFHRDRRCEKVSHRIHVLIYSHRDAEEAAATVMSLIRTSSCPGHVSFGVYQEFESVDDPDVYNTCLAMAADDEEREMVEHMRIVSREDASASKGPLYGIREAYRQTRKTEHFVLIVPVGTRAVSGWDATWTMEFTRARDSLPSSSGAIVLTCQPEELRVAGGGDRSLPKVREDGIEGVAQNFIRSMTDTTKSTIISKPRSTFPVLGRMNGRFPETSVRIFPQRNEEAVRSIMLGSCLMTTARTLRAALKYATVSCPPYAMNFMLSAIMHTHARAAFVAATPVFLRAVDPNNMRPKGWNSKELQQYMIHYYSDYCVFAGVDMAESTVHGRAVMGLLPDLSSADVLSKYGTRREFLRVKSQFS